MQDLTPYEKRVRAEIDQWRNEKDSLLTNTLNTISTPVEWLYKNVVPNNLNETLEKAVMGAFGMLNNAAQWTYSDNQIIKKAQKLGLDVRDYKELREYDIEKLDQLAQQYFMQNHLLAAIEGAGCGLGGLTLIAADVPLLFTISFRAVQQIGSSYGFEMDNPDMLLVVMNVFNAGSAGSSAAKISALADMHIAAAAFAKGGKKWTYNRIAAQTQTGVLAKLLKERTKYLPQQIAKHITKRKIGQVIPLVGALVGGGFNYWFLQSTTRAAYMIFRDMYLVQKYGTSEDIQQKLTNS
jgi:EcsC protein family